MRNKCVTLGVFIGIFYYLNCTMNFNEETADQNNITMYENESLAVTVYNYIYI